MPEVSNSEEDMIKKHMPAEIAVASDVERDHVLMSIRTTQQKKLQCSSE